MSELISSEIDQKYISDVLKDLNIISVNSENDKDDQIFSPEFVYQLFGENETCVGYENLKMNIYFSAASLYFEYQIQYKDTMEEIKVDLDGIIQSAIPINSKKFEEHRTRAELQLLDKNFKFPGKLVSSFTKSKENEIAEEFSLYFIRTVQCSKEELRYLEGMERFIPFFIEGGQYIDEQIELNLPDFGDDLNEWIIYYLVSKTEKKFVGFISIFNNYGFPDGIIPRISQVLILPTFRKRNICFEMLKLVYGDLHKQYGNSVMEIRAEDPNPSFQKIRDVLHFNLFLEYCHSNNVKLEDVMEWYNLIKYLNHKNLEEKLMKLKNELKISLCLFSRVLRMTQYFLMMHIFQKHNKSTIEQSVELSKMEKEITCNFLRKNFVTSPPDNNRPMIEERIKQLAVNEMNILKDTYSRNRHMVNEFPMLFK
ncbi:hypothetical protein SNEBB_007675 [Seison nebaliae]|nr:hypothetical protein SNEBB_007675 [Seison nebaliae]